LGLISAAPPGVTAVLVGFPLAAGSAALLVGWVYQGRLPAVLPAIGVLVLLVNLLAAGGIGFPGVAGSLWLLMAVGLNTARPDQPRRRLPRISAVAVLVVAVALAFACHLSGYRPVLNCRSKLEAAREECQRGNLAAAEEHLLVAAKADPLADEPWQQLASVALRRCQEEKTPEAIRRFEAYLERYNEVLAELAPNSSRAWLAAGELHREAHSITGRQGDIERAVEAYSRAVELYPNSGLCRAKLALAHKAAGQLEAFRREAARALWLDEQTPHADKKLPAGLRLELLAEEGPTWLGGRVMEGCSARVREPCSWPCIDSRRRGGGY